MWTTIKRTEEKQLINQKHWVNYLKQLLQLSNDENKTNEKTEIDIQLIW